MASPVWQTVASTVNATAGTSCQVTKPAGVVEGDLMIAVITISGTATVTAPANWTAIRNAVSTDVSHATFWKIAGASEPANYTFTWTGSVRNVGSIHRITGHRATTPIEGSAVSATGASNTPNPPSYAPGSSQDYLFVTTFGQAAKGNSATPPTNYTERSDVSTSGAGPNSAHAASSLATRALTTGAAEDPAAFASVTNGNWVANTIAIQPPAAPPGPQTIAVNAATETEAAQTITPTAQDSTSVTAAAESETAQAIVQGAVDPPELQFSGFRIDLVYTATSGQSVSVSPASESEAAQTITPSSAIVVALGAVSETEAAQAATVATATTTQVVAATEIETAEIISFALGVFRVLETEQARIIGTSQSGEPQTRPVDPASETETAQTVGFLATVTITVGGATETEAAETVTPQVATTVVVTAAAETEQAQTISLASATTLAVTAALESEAAGTVDPAQGGAPQTEAVGAATETEAAGTVGSLTQVSVLVGAAVESESAQIISLALGVPSAIETEQARIVGANQSGASQSRPVDPASETEFAQVVVGFSAQSVVVGAASESEIAEGIDPALGTLVAVTAAVETETATAIAVVAGATSIAVAFAEETEQANPVSVAVVFAAAIGAALETETALPIAFIQGAANIGVGPAVETETARPVVGVGGVFITLTGVQCSHRAASRCDSSTRAASSCASSTRAPMTVTSRILT